MVLRGKLNGAKPDTEAMDVGHCKMAHMVGERSTPQGRSTGKTAGAGRSENAGMSSVKYVRTVFAVSLRFPTPGQSASG